VSAVHAFVRRLWNDELGAAGRAVGLTLLPAELLYRAGSAARNRAFDRGLLRAERASVPVVSVGNLGVGGAGKTPFTQWLARRIADGGGKPAILHGGYADDEPELHRRWNPDIPVYAGRDRAASAARAAADGARVIVLDDGFQHRSLHRDIDLVLVAAERWTRRVRLLPRGPWREPVSALRRATLIIITRKTASPDAARSVAGEVGALTGRDAAIAWLRPCGWHTADGRTADAPDGPAVLASGVAEPALLAANVRASGAALAAELIFPDHHGYSEAEARGILAAAAGRPILTTAKDWVKLERWLEGADVRILQQEVVLEEGGPALDAEFAGVLT
jgi:tetraacyldisaccharide 4'-kinase